MRTLVVNAVVVGIIIKLACSLSLTITNVIGRSKRISQLISNSLFHERKQTHVIALYLLRKNKNYHVEGSSHLKAVDSGSNSPEEKLKLQISIESSGFLKNIIEYGNNRMARRAVGILQKMPAYRILPQEIHYTEAIKACEKSDQFSLAMSVYEEMKVRGIARTTATYAALISVAERTGHDFEAVQIYRDISTKGSSIQLSTDICNACIWAMGRCDDVQSIVEIMEMMSAQGIARSSDTYAAALNGCDVNGEGALALQWLQEMEMNGFELNAAVCNSAMWACVKGGGWRDALHIFNLMEIKGVQRDTNSYNAAIWAHEAGENSYKATELLRLMKFEGLARETVSFDGVLSALSKKGEWAQMLDILQWMSQDGVDKSYVTYRLVIDTLDWKKKFSYIDEIYLECLRNGHYSPWVKKTRQLDLRGFTTAIAKVAMKIVLLAIFEGKLSVFTLTIAVGDVCTEPSGEAEAGKQGGSEAFVSSSVDVDKLLYYLRHFYLESSRPSHVFGEEDSGAPPIPMSLHAPTHNVQEQTLEVHREIEDNVERLVIPREALVKWVEQEKKDLI